MGKKSEGYVKCNRFASITDQHSQTVCTGGNVSNSYSVINSEILHTFDLLEV